VLKAGLSGAYVTVDDTGARHAGKSGYTTQIGSSNFTAFRTGPSKSRLAFLSRLCGGSSLWVINEVALDYMRGRNLSQTAIDKFAGHKARIFASSGEWELHLQAPTSGEAQVLPDPVLIASEAALWGAIHHQGLLQGTVIVSDDAGQFRVGVHALCWVHAERLVYKLIPANEKQRNAVEVAKRMIWWFNRCLKDYKLAPGPEHAGSCAPASTASSSARETATPRSTACSNAFIATRTNCCGCSSGRKSRSTPTPRRWCTT